MNQKKGDKTKKEIPAVSKDKSLNWVQSLTYPIRDVLIASLDKGQFIIATIMLLIGLYIWKLPENKVTGFGDSLLNRFEANHLWGWFFFIFVSVVWYIHYNYISRYHKKELDRVTKEKDLLQENLFNKAIKN